MQAFDNPYLKGRMLEQYPAEGQPERITLTLKSNQKGPSLL